jgi:AcrR family transcriptional regulator
MASHDPLNPKIRILNSVNRLFYEQGFPNTGIQQIIEDSRSFKKSLYNHFPSKMDLGLSYLEKKEAEVIENLKQLFEKNPKYETFIQAWIKGIRKEIKSGTFRGCPFANFANQTWDERKSFAKPLIKPIKEMENFFTEVAQKSLKQTKNAPKFGRKILFLYEGLVQLYSTTGNIQYIDLLEEELLNLKKA